MEFGIAAIGVGALAGLLGFYGGAMVSMTVDLWYQLKYRNVRSIDELPAYEEIELKVDYDDCNAILFFDTYSRPANKDELSTLRLIAGPDQEFTLNGLPTLAQVRNIMGIPTLTKVIFNNYMHVEFIIERSA